MFFLFWNQFQNNFSPREMFPKVFLVALFLSAVISVYTETAQAQSTCCDLIKEIMFDCFKKRSISEDALANLSNDAKFVKYLPAWKNISDEYIGIVKATKRMHGLANTAGLLLAFEIKKSMEKEQPCDLLLAEYEEIKSQFPKSIRTLIWNEKLTLRNSFYNETLLAGDDQSARDSKRRSVFTSNSTEELDMSMKWKVETKDGQIFTFKNMHYNEYLYAPGDGFKQGVHRSIYTWRPGTKDFDEFWRIEIVGDDEIVMRHTFYHDELMFASPIMYLETTLRYVYTWAYYNEDKKSPLDEGGIWTVVAV